ncbi:HAD family hydrolase [Candidatus Bipolaricaulota bacterium]|nr:HAD family hydrolase [Candidatus Bipolaricaulota bacterium]
MEINQLTTVIFDLDGTLCTYEESLGKSLLRCFEVENVDDLPFTPEDYEEEFGRQFCSAIEGRIERPELSYRKRLVWSLLEPLSGFSQKQIAGYADRFDEVREEGLELFPESVQVLKRLQGGVKLGLLTNGPSSLQWAKIRHLGIEELFDEVVVSGDHGLVKPDPEIFHLTLDKMGSTPAESIYVGNSHKYDVEGAKNAGLPVIWRRNEGGERPDPDENYPEPDFVVDDLVEIFDLGILQLSDDSDSRRVKLS